MAKIENSNMGKDCKLIAASVEKDLVARIDELAKRDRITRSTWMREALISAWRRSEEFKRTPLHGYLKGPTDISQVVDIQQHGGGVTNLPPALQQTA